MPTAPACVAGDAEPCKGVDQLLLFAYPTDSDLPHPLTFPERWLMGRHSLRRTRPRWPLGMLAAALAVVLVAVLAVVMFSLLGNGQTVAGGCSEDGRESVTIAVDPAVSGVAERIFADGAAEGCAQVTLTDSMEEADSGLRFGYAAVRDGETLAPVSGGKFRTVAASPLLLATSGDAPGSWSESLARSPLAVPDPNGSAVGRAYLNLVASDPSFSEDQISEAAWNVGEAARSASRAFGSADDRFNAASGDGVAVVTEAEWVEYRAENEDTEIEVSAPEGVSAAVPIGLDSSRSILSADEIRAAIGGYLEPSDEVIADAGLRPVGEADGDVLSPKDLGSAPEGGAGELEAARYPSPETIRQLSDAWATAGTPLRALIVIDVSGSMEAAVGPTTRMGVTTQALQGVVKQFPYTAELGLWVFSRELEGDRDYREVVAMDRLSNISDGSTHRARMLAASEGLADQVGGETGLYDTSLAAFREMKDNYDPDYTNAVVLVTDGRNEDPGSPSLAALQESLEREQSEEEPVRIIAIGISEDADMGPLTDIADATGGSAHGSANPADIDLVFGRAIAQGAREE